MARTGITYVTACLGVAVTLAACSSTPSDTSSGSASSVPDVTQATPFAPMSPPATKPLPSVTWALALGEPVSLDPISPFNSSTNVPLANMCEPLLRQQPDGAIVPGLASSFETPDATTYVFKLRDAKFWDGSTMTSADVVASLSRAKDAALGSGYAGDFAGVDSVTATDPKTVTIKLKQADSLFTARMTTGAGTVLSKAFIDKTGGKLGTSDTGLMCTGPYQLESWKSGDSINLTAFSGWWGLADTKPLVPKAKFVFITDEAAITAAAVAGDIDGAFGIPKVAIERLNQGGGAGKAFTAPAGLIREYSMLFGGAFGNVKLRQAMAKGLDYTGINSAVFGATAQAARTLVSPSLWGQGPARAVFEQGYNAIPLPAQNIEEGKKLVAESGVSNPTVVIAAAQGYKEQVTLANAARQAAEAVGIKATVKELPVEKFAALYSPDPKAREGIDMFFLTDIAVLPNPLGFYAYITLPTGAGNWAGWNDKQAQDLVNQALAATDPVKQAELTNQAQAVVMDQLPFIPVSYQLATLYLKDGVTGVQAGEPSNFFWPWLAYVGGQ